MAGIDIQSGLSRVSWNKKLYRSLLVKFYNEYHDSTVQIKEALAREDQALATRLAHTVKGVAGNLGAKNLQAAGAGVEKAIAVSSTDNIDVLLQTYEHQIQSVMNGLKDFVASEEAREETKSVNVAGDLSNLNDFLKKLLPLIKKRKPKLCKEILEQIKACSWPENLTIEIEQLQKITAKYKFKEALPIAESLIEQLGDMSVDE